MGRAYEVRKASIQKTGAMKAKLYSMYSREIYEAAKKSGTNLDANVALKRLVEKARKEQVPFDIINRAIEKVNSGANESYETVRYEIFGPRGSTLIVDCLTDNVNRTLSYVRPVLNKNNGKMGVSGSVTHMYEHLCIVRFKGLTEETVLDALINNEVDVVDIEVDNDNITIYGEPQDLYKIKEVINSLLPNIEFEVDEIAMIPKMTVTLEGEDLENFKRMYQMLDEIEDVKDIYQNVANVSD
ncbi:MAG: YebC/PmpR family DNA-binding transcriptional regulator [Mollicutes bacterium]|jgi:YebC/PmpR family DNA-binding regulatory protein|nr:YebC/PmpR family DNA-binding transcriptional regulator [Mollicutes bacterium]